MDGVACRSENEGTCVTPNMGAQLRELLGDDAVSSDAQGKPRTTPTTTEQVASVCVLAREQKWTMRVAGRGSWLVSDTPADLALTTRALDRIVAVQPADLVATVEAGVSFQALRERLAREHMWLALDPPGHPERSIGSVVATATAGPLRLGFGGVRDHVLGCTVVTGDGRVVRVGGRVVKNVAGFDITRLQVGGFGGFGIITELHLRLRAMPASDRTLVARGDRDALTSAGRDLSAAHVSLQALELFSPALAAESEWVLAARLLGTGEGTEAESQRLAQVAPTLTWREIPADHAAAFWHLSARAMLGAATTLRLGVLQDGLDDAIDLLADALDEGLVAAGVGASGGLRWSGEAGPDQINALRRTLAPREIPLTLERAPWSVRRAVGHFGAYREGVGQVVGRLRETFDPGRVLRVAIEAEGAEKAEGAEGRPDDPGSGGAAR